MLLSSLRFNVTVTTPEKRSRDVAVSGFSSFADDRRDISNRDRFVSTSENGKSDKRAGEMWPVLTEII